jgi:5'-methylthioadenosine phosphorylase
MAQANIAVIGGSGLYEMQGLNIVDKIAINTPFGPPSDEILIGNFGVETQNIAFLPRHGRGHRLLPTEINSKANIWALKSLGVKWIFSASAVGSLKEEIAPRDFVIPDQIIDRTKSRANSFFGEGLAGHVTFADPFCAKLTGLLGQTAQELGIKVHQGGIYICMEGPLFSTRAESNLYRSWNGACIGMTALPEAKLAREAEIAYATLAMATDYDCWYIDEDVSVEGIMENMRLNIENCQKIIKKAAQDIFADPDNYYNPKCHEAAKFAIMTAKEAIPLKTKEKLALLYQKYF